MNKSNYEVNILINGKPVREFYHNGKFYIEARQNSEFSVKLKNHSHKKILCVLSIDGIDSLKGKPGSEAESGYVLNPYSSTEIKGYRIDDNSVASFVFTDGKQSYSTEVKCEFNQEKIQEVKEGKASPSKNNGVIGVRIYEEKEPKVIPEWNTKSQNIKNRFYNQYHYEGNVINGVYAYSSCISANFTGVTGAYWGGVALSGCSIGINGVVGSAGIAGGTAGTASYTCSTNISTSNRKRSILPRNDISQFGQLGVVNNLSVNTITDNCVLQAEEYVATKSVTPNFTLGTAWGEQVVDKVIKTTFDKSDKYIDLEIFYLERSELEKIGIDVNNSKKVFISGWPEAFGGDEEYCPKPTNWR